MVNMSIMRTSMESGVYIRNPDVVLRDEREDGGLIFNPDTGEVRWLNQTGKVVWQLCDGTQTLESIRDHIVSEFNGASSDEVEKDILDFARDLLSHGFIGTQEVL
jgi:hypothetical protein